MYFKGVLLRSGKRMSPLFVLMIIFTTPIMCQGQLDNPCGVFPKDQYIEEGSSIDIVCQTSCTNTKEVFWRLNNRSVDRSLSKTINSTHTVLSLRNFTHHSATIQCESRKPDQVIGGTIIKTYQKPRKISCIWHHESNERIEIEEWYHNPEILTCNWEHQIDPPLEVNYTVLCTPTPGDPPLECCKTRQTKCDARGLDSGSLSLFDESTITVRATTAKWEVSSDPYILYPYKIMKIVRPKVEVTAFTDHLVVKCSRSLAYWDGRCQVSYTRADETTPERLINMSLRADENGDITIGDVESCVNYSVSVRCALDEAPWSDWRHETVLTKLNPNHVRLRLWRKITETENSQVRKVRAMWTDIPSSCQETGEVNYAIKRTTGANYTYTSCGGPTCDIDVNQDAQTITLTVYHDGRPIAEDSVYVPAIGDSLPQVTDIQTSTSDGNILISWKAPAQPVSGYMIDWTHDGNQYHWNESKYTNATLFDLLDKKPYDVTITPVFDSKAGHGTQILQVCSRVGDPGSVDIIGVQANDRNVYVRWDTKRQDPCSGAVTNFTVYYGPPDGPLLNVTVGGDQQEIFLKDLTKDSQYTVYVEATAVTGNSKSKERFFKTKRFDPRLVMVLSVCGSVFIVLALSVGLCCAVQWKKFWEKPVPNPGLSSVALWPSPTAQKMNSGACLFQPFINPSGELCDKVNSEHTPSVSSPSLVTDSTDCQPSDQLEEHTDTAVVLAPDAHDGEATAFLSSKSSPVSPVSPVSPYRSQSSVESTLPENNKQRTLKTIYVTLDMFEHGQSRRGK